jgi:hypothetical protein
MNFSVGDRSGSEQTCRTSILSAAEGDARAAEALVTVSLARRAEQEAAVPAAIKPAFVQVADYFQYIADSTSITQPKPEGAPDA